MTEDSKRSLFVEFPNNEYLNPQQVIKFRWSERDNCTYIFLRDGTEHSAPFAVNDVKALLEHKVTLKDVKKVTGISDWEKNANNLKSTVTITNAGENPG